MKRAVLAAVVWVGVPVAPLRAETLPLVEGVPATYTPGESFTFTLRVPALSGFTGYSVELSFATDVQDPPLIAFPTLPPANRYVFPSSANFGFGLETPPGAQEVRLRLGDSASPGVGTTPGGNDTLATITVSPGANLLGPITITVAPASGFDFGSEQNQLPLPQPVIVQQAEPPVGGNPVPAPPAATLAGAGLLALGLRGRLGRRAA